METETETNGQAGGVNEGYYWERLYWEYAALTKKRFWWFGGFAWIPFLGDDEYGRTTLVIGPVVVALWRCKCDDYCKNRISRLEEEMDRQPL